MKKILASDKIYDAEIFLTVISCIALAIYQIISSDLYIAQTSYILIVSMLCAVTYLSYKNNKIGLMKIMLPITMAVNLSGGLIWLFFTVLDADTISYVSYSIFSAVLLINHFIINSANHRTVMGININYICIFVLIIINFVDTVFWIPNINGIPMAVSVLYYIVGYPVSVISILFAEKRIGAYDLPTGETAVSV